MERVRGKPNTAEVRTHMCCTPFAQPRSPQGQMGSHRGQEQQQEKSNFLLCISISISLSLSLFLCLSASLYIYTNPPLPVPCPALNNDTVLHRLLSRGPHLDVVHDTVAVKVHVHPGV